MRKIIEFLISRYNKKAKPEDQIVIKTPVTYQARTTSKLDIKLLSEDTAFLRNIIEEKKYDLRLQLIDFVNKDGDIKYEIEKEDQKLTITAKLKVYGEI